MAEEENSPNPPPQAEGSKLPLLLIIGGVGVVALALVVFMMMGSSGPAIEEEVPPAEYQVAEKMYQLKDGSYLRLSFSVVVAADKLAAVANIIEKESPGRLPSGITMLLGNKGRDELINGTHKREAFAREIKKMLEERVFGEYNKRQNSSTEMIEVREVLISDFVTQHG